MLIKRGRRPEEFPRLKTVELKSSNNTILYQLNLFLLALSKFRFMVTVNFTPLDKIISGLSLVNIELTN